MRALIWGTGILCGRVVSKIRNAVIVGYINSEKRKNSFAGKPLYSPDEVGKEKVEYDAILVATVYAQDIYECCLENGIDVRKVIFAYGNIKMEDLNVDYEFITRICGEQFGKEIEDRYHLARGENYLLKPKRFDLSMFRETPIYKNDYVRIKTFELLCSEIDQHGICGNVAECGVFRGEFAQYINAAFPDRKLYLFDTFEGFREEELRHDVEGETQNVHREVYKDVCVESVMKKMKYPNQVFLKKGYFPESINGLEDIFAFVSLDTDWEEPLYQGINYFYPRLSKGGYIMMHDYNVLEGAYKAVKRYEETIGENLAKVPLCDGSGSIIITK